MLRCQTFIALLLIALLSSVALADGPDSPQTFCGRAHPGELTHMQFEAAEQVLQADTDYHAIFCTSAGAIYLDLYERLTPTAVNNFVFLARQGYYDGTTFHRVIPDFMAQGGDPTGSGRGGPGYRFGDEPVGFLTFDRPGLLAMANAGPGTNGSQFFITTAPTPHLNYKHTIFGDVLAGQDIVENIRERDPQTAAEPGETLHTVIIIDDPSQIGAGVMPDPEPASPDQVAARFEAFISSLPPSLPTDAERSGHFSTEDLVATVSDDLREAFAAFAADHGHAYRQRAQFINSACDETIFFAHLGYWVDVYADAASSSAAAHDGFMLRWLESYGYEAEAGANGVYTAAATYCDGEKGRSLLSLKPIGRFLVTLDVLVAEAILDQVSAAALLDNLALQIEPGFADIYRPEIRA